MISYNRRLALHRSAYILTIDEHSGLLVAQGTLNPEVTLVSFLNDELKRNEGNLKHTRH